MYPAVDCVNCWVHVFCLPFILVAQGIDIACSTLYTEIDRKIELCRHAYKN